MNAFIIFSQVGIYPVFCRTESHKVDQNQCFINPQDTTLKRTKECINALDQTDVPVYFDTGLLTKARLEITWAKPAELHITETSPYKSTPRFAPNI